MGGLLALPQPGDVVGGKYLLESVVDRCEFGAVFAARHRHTGRRFALRWLAGSGSNTSEASAADAPALAANGEVIGCFQHPFVLSPIDFGRTRTARYLVMEWLDGETFAARLKRQPKLPLADAARILVPCMRSLHEAHLADVVHAELRPGNIFICSGLNHQAETVRVFDYSLARPLSPVPLVTDSGQYTRHAYYLAPEQITGAPTDRRSDVYAFGVILYRALSGRIPFSSENADEFARWVYAQDPQLPALAGGLTPATYRLLMRAMARDPLQRFESCHDLANAVETLVRNPGLEEINALPASPSGFQRAAKRASHVATMRLPVTVHPPQDAQPSAAPQLETSVRTMRVVMELGATPQRPAVAPKNHIPTQPLQLLQMPQSDAPQLGPGSMAPLPPAAAEPRSHFAPRTAAAPEREAEHPDGFDSLEPRVYQRPFDRRMLAAAACFAVVGAIPLAAYYTPPVERPDATIHEDLTPHRRPTALAMPPAQAAPRPQPAAAAVQPAPALPKAALKDDPSTLVDESDPLIAAALASIRQPKPAEHADEAMVIPAIQVPPAPAKEAPRAKPAPARAAAKPPVAATAPKRAPAPPPPAAAAALPTVDVKAPAVLQIPDARPSETRSVSAQPAKPARPTAPVLREDPSLTQPSQRPKDMNLF